MFEVTAALFHAVTQTFAPLIDIVVDATLLQTGPLGNQTSLQIVPIESKRTRSPAGAGIANRPLEFLGIFLIFGSNTPTWSVENQLNL